MYKIISRILNGRETIGYQLLAENNCILNIEIKEVLNAAANGMILNAAYNKHTGSLVGCNGTDLREIKSVKYSDIIKSKQDSNRCGIKYLGRNKDKYIINKNGQNVEVSDEAIILEIMRGTLDTSNIFLKYTSNESSILPYILIEVRSDKCIRAKCLKINRSTDNLTDGDSITDVELQFDNGEIKKLSIESFIENCCKGALTVSNLVYTPFGYMTDEESKLVYRSILNISKQLSKNKGVSKVINISDRLFQDIRTAFKVGFGGSDPIYNAFIIKKYLNRVDGYQLECTKDSCTLFINLYKTDLSIVCININGRVYIVYAFEDGYMTQSEIIQILSRFKNFANVNNISIENNIWNLGIELKDSWEALR